MRKIEVLTVKSGSEVMTGYPDGVQGIDQVKLNLVTLDKRCSSISVEKIVCSM